MRDALAEHGIRLAQKPETTSVELVLHPGSRGAHGFVTFFLYDGGEPFCLAKVPRVQPNLTEHEATNLTAVAAALEDSSLQTKVDRVLGTVEIDGKIVMFKHLCGGRPASQLIASAEPADVQRALRAAVDWFITFLKDTAPLHQRDPEAKRAAALEIVAAPEAQSWFDTFVASNHQVVGPAHGDLVPANILLHSTGVSAVVDFENYRDDGLPFADFVGLIVSTAVTAFGRDEAMIDLTFRTHSWLSAEVANHVQRYCATTGCSIEEFVTMLPMYSDRSLAIASRWNMPHEVAFHELLRTAFTADAAVITEIFSPTPSSTNGPI